MVATKTKTKTKTAAKEEVKTIENMSFVVAVELTLKRPILGAQPMTKDLFLTCAGVKMKEAEKLKYEQETLKNIDLVAEAENRKFSDPKKDEHSKITAFARDDVGIYIGDHTIKGWAKQVGKQINQSGVKMHNGTKDVSGTKQKLTEMVVIEPTRLYLMDEDGNIKQRPDGYCDRIMRTEDKMTHKNITTPVRSEACYAGTKLRALIKCMGSFSQKNILQLLAYGTFRGIGQWTNAGFGVFSAQAFDADGNELEVPVLSGDKKTSFLETFLSSYNQKTFDLIDWESEHGNLTWEEVHNL